ncbi:RNA polymerase alpha subunit C-terminal domain-containing protein [Maribellus maritimus]|uniref:RNA polymerase alpha subunit C-terminal domain-containing protein n=1 Tax=Maribellus maritimus TaxID=2870838 RepID=UPI001EEA642D|nr:RNA polymerase alpha subunit C-terminal domain-containing protein [Maribellus maritimus]MCG6186162.1 RNA polymerase alpha subunit C-terminal domain-containing protein [Maribellus maritimus]
MQNVDKTLRICEKGHRYYKSSDCPTCPQCEKERKPKVGFLSHLSAPARRALEKHDITSVEELSNFSENEILELHGVGKNVISKLRDILKENGLQFKK